MVDGGNVEHAIKDSCNIAQNCRNITSIGASIWDPVVLAADSVRWPRLRSPQQGSPVPPWGPQSIPRTDQIYNPSIVLGLMNIISPPLIAYGFVSVLWKFNAVSAWIYLCHIAPCECLCAHVPSTTVYFLIRQTMSDEIRFLYMGISTFLVLFLIYKHNQCQINNFRGAFGRETWKPVNPSLIVTCSWFSGDQFACGWKTSLFKKMHHESYMHIKNNKWWWILNQQKKSLRLHDNKDTVVIVLQSI